MIHHYVKTPDGQTHHEKNCRHKAVGDSEFCALHRRDA